MRHATGLAPAAAGALARLIHPVSTTEFLASYWEKRPLLVQRRRTDYFDGLFTLADFDQLLAVSRLGTSTIRILKDGREVPPPTGASQHHTAIESTCQQFASGATVSFQAVHERVEPVAALCRELAHECSAAFQVNAYLTPPHCRGLGLHHDTHDVFVVQTAGSKQWKVYGALVQLPTRSQRFDRRTMQPGPVEIETVLQAGDTLYLPRGFVHEAASTEDTSLHLTVGVYSVKLGTLLSTHLDNVIAATPALRQSLPPGFARSPAARRQAARLLRGALDTFTRSTDPTALIDDAALSVSTSAPAPLAGRLLAADAAHHLTPSTRIRPRSGAVIRQTKTRQHLSLTYQGRLIRLPATAGAAIRHLLTHGSTTAGSLPGPLDIDSKLLLVKHLLAEGFCELES